MFQTTHQWYIRYKPMNTFPPFQTPEVSDRWSGLRQILSPWILRFFPWTRCQTFHGVAGVAPIFRPSLISLICCFHHFPSFSITFHHFPSLSITFHHFPSFSIIFNSYVSLPEGNYHDSYRIIVSWSLKGIAMGFSALVGLYPQPWIPAVSSQLPWQVTKISSKKLVVSSNYHLSRDDNVSLVVSYHQ